jgi:choline-sulfatase
MVRQGRFKFVYYVGLPPQLFDLESDPDETTDLASDPAFAATCRELEQEVRRFVDPEAADAAAKASQHAKIEAAGGREVVEARGPAFEIATPAPTEFMGHGHDDRAGG